MEHGEELMTADPNNNTTGCAVGAEKCEKYSLRPRATLKRGDDDEDGDLEGWKPRAKNKKRAKQKSAPLSKYRRKTANARERCRMREINEAFETLRRVLPHLSTPEVDANEKLTKISTLRLAMKYIATLSRMLREADVESSSSDGESSFFGAGSECSSTAATDCGSDRSSRTPTTTFSDQSLASVDLYADQLMLSPADDFVHDHLRHQLHYLSQDHHHHHLLPYCDLDVALTPSSSRTPSLTDDLPSLASLPLSDDFVISDYVIAATAATTSDDCDIKLDSCLPEITFDDSEYALDSLISSV